MCETKYTKKYSDTTGVCKMSRFWTKRSFVEFGLSVRGSWGGTHEDESWLCPSSSLSPSCHAWVSACAAINGLLFPHFTAWTHTHTRLCPPPLRQTEEEKEINKIYYLSSSTQFQTKCIHTCVCSSARTHTAWHTKALSTWEHCPQPLIGLVFFLQCPITDHVLKTNSYPFQ